jgi:hypothetical protein
MYNKIFQESNYHAILNLASKMRSLSLIRFIPFSLEEEK